MAKKPVMKWQLTAWPEGPRFVKVGRNTRTTAVFRRDYTSPAAANRAAPQVHRLHPAAQLVIMPFTLKGLWCGDSRDEIPVCFCPGCDKRLDWADDQWHCPGCGGEWHDEQIRKTNTAS